MATTEESLALALDCYQRGAVPEAEQLFRQVLQAEPQHAEAHYYLGLALHRQGRLMEAVASFQQALQCRPGFAEAFSALGATFQQSVQNPSDASEARSDLGASAPAQGNLDAMVADDQQAAPMEPASAEAYNAEAHRFYCESKLDEALASVHQALRCNPYYVEAHLKLQVLLRAQGKLEEALANSEHAIRLRPDFPQAHLVRAQTLLCAGDFERGWKEYAWRTSIPLFGMPLISLNRPAWDGSPLNGRTIFLRPEQGMGDTMQFVRYAPLLKQQDCRVVVECQPPLVPLLKSCPGIDQIIPQGEIPPHYDVYALLLSVPGLLGTRLATVPVNIPYLFADPALVAHWRQELSAVQGYKVGIAWQGSTLHQLDRLRSALLTDLAPLAEVEGVHLVSLQKGEGTEQLRGVAERFAVTDLGPDLDEKSGAFMDTAAVMMNLDLVVTVDSALAHLAGAMGVPVWLALSFSPDWRWMVGRDDSPWYPSMRLFRQHQPGNYREVFANMAVELAKRLGSNP